MKQKRFLAFLMTLIMLISCIVPENALIVRAEDDLPAVEVYEAAGDEEDPDESEETTEDREEAEDSGEAIDEEEAEGEADAAVDGEEPENVEYAGLPYGLKGMPEGYVMSADERSIKKDVAAHAVAEDVKGMTAGSDYRSNEVFLLADDAEYAENVAAAYNAELISFDGYVAVLDLSLSGLSVDEAVAIGADARYNLPAVEPNYIITLDPVSGSCEYDTENAYRNRYKNEESGWEDVVAAMSSSDPYLLPNDVNYQWWHDVIGSYGAWGLYGYDFSGSGITVAVIDTGVNYTHEEMKGHTTADGTDPDGHGSNVAGIIGATAGNGKGGAGVAPGVNIIGYTTANSEGKLDTNKIISAVKSSADKGVNIINMSLGGPSYTASFKSAIDYAYNKNVTIVAAAGNESANTVCYPACYDHVISVAALQPDGSLTTFSNNGDTLVDIAAPGADMMSINNGGNSAYVKMQGTSQASPVVAGACAAYMSIHGAVGPDEMEKVLKSSATKTKAKGDGAGIVNLAAMLEGDTTGPQLSIVNAAGDTVTVESGKSGSLTALADATISVTKENFEGNSKANTKTQIFFTVNGKAPSFEKSGKAKEGTYLCTDGKIVLANFPIYMNAANGGKVTVKVQCVTGMGVVSKVSSMTVTVNPGEDKELDISAPSSLALGGKAALSAILTKASGTRTSTVILSKGVKWSITSGSELASINGSGVLSAGKSASGTVTVQADYGKLSATAAITVGNYGVKSIELSDTKLAMSYDKDSEVFGTKYQQIVSVANATDAEGNDVTAASYVSFAWSSSNTSVARVSYSGNGRTATITARGKGSAKITCIATDGCGAKAVVNVTVINLVRSISISGQDYIAKGQSATYKAAITPSDAKLKTVEWSVASSSDGTGSVSGVSCDSKKGTVKVEGGSGSFYVIAKATDGSGTIGYKSVTIVNEKSTGIKISSTATDSAYDIKKDKGGSINSAQLYTVNASSSTVNEKVLTLSADLGNGSMPMWRTSNNKVVAFNSSGTYVGMKSDSVTLYAIGTGSATISCTALDGSGKKASIKIKVIVPVSSLEISTPVIGTYCDPDGVEYTFSSLGTGKSVSNKLVFGEAYGKPSVNKVKWSYEPVKLDIADSENAFKPVALSESTKAALTKEKLFSGSNGKISFNKKFFEIAYNNANTSYIGVVVTATATDGSGVSVSRIIAPMSSTTKVMARGQNGKWASNAKWTFGAEGDFEAGYRVGIGWNGSDGCDFSVTSSNPSVATGYYDSNYKSVTVSWGSKKGKAVLTVKAKDGSGKSCKITINVK